MTLLTTPIMKTDLSGSTVRFRSLPGADLTALLSEHRALIGRMAAAHGGRIVKPEGDGFFICFPSVTAAALAAMAMQEELRVGETGKGDRRLVMRIVLTLGDVLHEEGALVGDAVVLATRIEALTPPGEIYLSAAAGMAVNKAEVRTALVDVFTLKGFPNPLPVYRVEDLKGFSATLETAPMSEVEKILDRLRELVDRVCRDFDGVSRMSVGDSYCLTFADPKLALAAVERLVEEWHAPGRPEAARCSLGIGVHKGVLYAFRDFLHGPDLNIATLVERALTLGPARNAIAAVTGPVRRDLSGTEWDARFRRVDVGPGEPRLKGIEIDFLVRRGAA